MARPCQAYRAFVSSGVSMEQRRAERATVCRKLALEWPGQDGTTEVLPALSRDLSISGACVSTRKPLKAGDHVRIRIPTDGCPKEWGLPDELEGEAEVKRIARMQGGIRQVALAFEPCLQRSMELGYLMAFLLGRSSAANHAYA